MGEEIQFGDFPGGPVVKTLRFHCRGHRIDPGSGKFHMPCGAAKKKKKKRFSFAGQKEFCRWMVMMVVYNNMNVLNIPELYALKMVKMVNSLYFNTVF